MAEDRPKQPAYAIFTIKRGFSDFSSLSSALLGLKKPSHAGAKERYHVKVVILPLVVCSVKTAADR